MRKARVFISCGLRTGKEKRIGNAVEKFFKQKGFETYLAEKVHSPEGLTENIFRFMRSSEYFVFIDFKRNLINSDTYRGSLFVNQELAIATFLQIPGLGFTEKGVKREGILDYQIWNAFDFEDGKEILSRIESETDSWDPNSINELSIEFEPGNITKNVKILNNEAKPITDWYHLTIINNNKYKHALSCVAYVTKIHNLEINKDITFPTIELIWSGIRDYRANIIAEGKRELGAFFVMQKENDIRFNHLDPTTTEKRFWMPNLGKGNYIIEYTIISANFETVSRSFRITHMGNYGDVNMVPEYDNG